MRIRQWAGVLLLSAFFACAAQAFAVTDAAETCSIAVPQVIVDKVTETEVEGTVSRAMGQTIVLRSADGEALFDEVKAGDSGGPETFRLTLPETEKEVQTEQPEDKSERELVVGSMPVPGAAASRMVPVNDPAAVEETAPSAETAATEPPPVQESAARPQTAEEGRAAAVAWARQIAADNRFTYGATPYSRHNGCYFCHTNGGKKKRAKKTKWKNGYQGKTWEMTYCCNPFVHAAYAHGAQHPKMLSACRKMNAIDMSRSSYKKMGCFQCLGKPKFAKLIPGDIFVGSNHVWLYCGGNELAEATSLGGRAKSWSADAIRVTGGAKSRYRKCRFVMRFTGY
ncbi:MAG: hypothetical protein Q4F96_02705 [Bacillota bacterium]|nr:hypothetical protein [Bacillota bacterium]